MTEGLKDNPHIGTFSQIAQPLPVPKVHFSSVEQVPNSFLNLIQRSGWGFVKLEEFDNVYSSRGFNVRADVARF